MRSAPPNPGKTTPVPTNAAPAESSANVKLSSAASSLAAVQKKSINADFDVDKVAQVSQAINNNSYKVNAEVIADKLISNAQELLGKVAQ